jgi:hypothetical protein
MNEVIHEERSEGCGLPVEDWLTVPTKDFLVFLNEKRQGLVNFKKAKDRLLQRYLKDYNIRNGTCIAKLLTYLVDYVRVNEESEKIPYSVFYETNETKGWSESTIRKNLKRLERLGIVKIQDDGRKNPRRYQIYKEATGRDYRKVVVLRDCIDSSEIKSKELSFSVLIRDCTPEEIITLEREGWTFLEMIDLRGKSEKQRADIVFNIYHRKIGPYSLTREKRSEIVEQVVNELKQNPHIREVFLTGSMASEQYLRCSDIDFLLIRESCPGKDRCYRSKTPECVDLLCYTPNEFRRLKEKKALLTYYLKPLYQRGQQT